MGLVLFYIWPHPSGPPEPVPKHYWFRYGLRLFSCLPFIRLSKILWFDVSHACEFMVLFWALTKFYRKDNVKSQNESREDIQKEFWESYLVEFWGNLNWRLGSNPWNNHRRNPGRNCCINPERGSRLIERIPWICFDRTFWKYTKMNSRRNLWKNSG